MRVQIHDQVFNETTPDLDGTYWIVTDLDGWASAAVRSASVTPTFRHGSVPASGFYQPRSLTVKGVVKAPTETLFWKAYNRLNSITNNLKITREMQVTEDVVKSLYYVRAAEVRMTFVGVGAITFELPLSAPDPLKYGAPVNATLAAGTTEVVNAGNETSYRITGQTSADGVLSLHNEDEGRTITTATRQLPSGTDLDFWRRTVKYAGGNRYDYLHPTSSWWGLKPGSNSIVNGGPAVPITYRPAWA